MFTQNNIKINFLHPIIIINKIISKLDVNKKTFVSVLTSVAGLRGRSKRLFYCSAKAGMISYLSGLRQKFSKTNTRVITIIPGYMSTKPFSINSPKFLITSPQKSLETLIKTSDFNTSSILQHRPCPRDVLLPRLQVILELRREGRLLSLMMRSGFFSGVQHR